MRVVIETPLGVAAIQDGVWSSDVPKLAERLQSVARPNPAEWYPDPDVAMAQGVVDMFGGRVTFSSEPDLLEGVEY